MMHPDDIDLPLMVIEHPGAEITLPDFWLNLKGVSARASCYFWQQILINRMRSIVQYAK